MIPHRPILFLSLPSLAIILGLVWFRRKKSAQCDSGGDTKESKLNSENNDVVDDRHTKGSESLPITPQLLQSKNENHACSSSSSSSSSGKSAPIDIIPSTKSPPKLTDKEIDSELLKLKLQEKDIKNLRSIVEQDDSYSESPLELIGSMEPCQKYVLFNDDMPVVVTANNVAKVSPKNSFATELVKKDYEAQDKNETVINQTCEENEIVPRNSCSDNEVRNLPAASPALSLCSLRSGDSGKGSSPPHSEGAPTTSYEFLLPSYLVSKMLGRKAAFAQQIKLKSGANILIKRHPNTHKSKICSLEGTQIEIDSALAMVRKKMPERRYPALTLQRIYMGTIEKVVELPILDTTTLQLQLIEGINNDVTISAIVNGGQVFLQQPLHPSFPSLNVLQNCMNQSYSMTESPLLPELKEGSVCVVVSDNNWYRVQIVSYNPEAQTCVLKYLDYGGYASVPAKELRQIRTDFMVVPFQSNECLLSNLKPVGDYGWSTEAAEILFNLTNGLILQAQVAGYSVDGLPEIYLFASIAKDNVIFINEELVARNLAEWVEDASSSMM